MSDALINKVNEHTAVIKKLRKRIEELERRPIYVPQPYHVYPYYQPQPPYPPVSPTWRTSVNHT